LTEFEAKKKAEDAKVTEDFGKMLPEYVPPSA